jgi:hypothetical protein
MSVTHVRFVDLDIKQNGHIYNEVLKRPVELEITHLSVKYLANTQKKKASSHKPHRLNMAPIG